MRDDRVAVYCGTRNLYRRMSVIARSAVVNGAADRVIFLTEDDEFPDVLPDFVEVRNVSGQKWFRSDGPNYDCRWTWMSLMKAALPVVLPEYDRVLSLDTDTLVHHPAGGIWDTDLDNVYAAAVREKTDMRVDRPVWNREPYFNFGVALLNLRKLRADGKDREVIWLLNEQCLEYPDQDAMNIACYGKIAELDPRFGMITAFYPELAEQAKITHYCSHDKMIQTTHEYNHFRRMNWGEVCEQRKMHMEERRKSNA